MDVKMRPTHDLRHASITNAAAAGVPPEALMVRAGHSSYSTTKRYIDLSGERFRAEADRLEGRLWGTSGRKSGYKPDPSEAHSSPEGDADRLGIAEGEGFEPSKSLHP